MHLSLPLYSLLPITFSFINFIIGLIFVYLYFVKTHRKLVFLGLWIISLSIFSLLVGFSHVINNYYFAIWWAKIYYIFLNASVIFYMLFIRANVQWKPILLFYIIIGLLLSYFVLIFTKHFIPFIPCIKDFTGRFIFKKGLLYPAFMFLFYTAYIISAFNLLKMRKKITDIESIPFNRFWIGVMVLLIIGINDFAGILGWYKTVPLISYGFIIFNILLIEPFFKRYIILFQDLDKNYKDTIRVFGKMLEIKDPLSYGNARRVGLYAKYIGEKMKLSKDKIEKLELAALLYNIGEIGVPDKLLRSNKISCHELDLLHKKIEEGKKIISRMVLLYNLKELINFPEFKKLNKQYVLLTQILSVADYINKRILSSYLENKFNFEQILIDIKNNDYLNKNLINTILSNSNKIENLILENLLLLKEA